MADLADGRTPSSDSILLRTAAWGTAAAVALGAFVFTAQSEDGGRRLQLALDGSLIDKPQILAAVVPPRSQPPDPALKSLQAKIDRLDSERLRVDARLTNVEQGLQDVTGSIRRQTEAHPAAPTATKPPIIEPPLIPAISTLPPSTKQAAAAPVENPPPAPEPAMAKPATMDAAHPEPAPAEVPVPRARPHHSPVHAEFGIELGTAVDMQALNSRWSAIKANFGPLLVGLSPVGVKDPRPGSNQLRLMAGPLKSMAAARELCAKFAAANGYCWPRKVDATDIVQR